MSEPLDSALRELNLSENQIDDIVVNNDLINDKIMTNSDINKGKSEENELIDCASTLGLVHTNVVGLNEIVTNENVNDDIAGQSDEDDGQSWQSEQWRKKDKHVFILSKAGKPIYCRHGSEEKLATLFSVMQALVSVFEDSQDEIHSIHCEESQIAFLQKEHIILVSVDKKKEEHFEEARLQLNYVYNQIISILTFSQLARVFDLHTNFDLRRLLSGAERLIDAIISFTETEASFFLGGVECLPLISSTRDLINQAIISSCNKLKNLLFAILVAENQLVAMVRMKKYDLQPQDMHIIFNFVNSSQSFKSAESWTPLCLPNFDSSGSLQVHVSYLADDCQICLLLVAIDRDMFFSLSEAKQNIVEKLRKNSCIEQINKSLCQRKVKTTEFGLPSLRHFVYKDKNTSQFLYPMYEAPYLTSELQLQLFEFYKETYFRLNSSYNPLKIIYQKLETETMLAWDSKQFQLFLILEPFVSKPEAISTVNKLLKNLKKKEDRLFITSIATF